MKLVLSLISITLLGGCEVISPRFEYPRPAAEIVYVWDRVRLRYYYVEDNRRVYMPEGWQKPEHTNGMPPGQRKKAERDR